MRTSVWVTLKEEPLNEEGEENETEIEPESTVDPKEDRENDTEDNKEIADEDEQASDLHIETEALRMDDGSP